MIEKVDTARMERDYLILKMSRMGLNSMEMRRLKRLTCATK